VVWVCKKGPREQKNGELSHRLVVLQNSKQGGGTPTCGERPEAAPDEELEKKEKKLRNTISTLQDKSVRKCTPVLCVSYVEGVTIGSF